MRDSHQGKETMIPQMKTLRIAGIILLAIVAFTGLLGGWTLMANPSGSSIQLSPDYLKATPFKSYFIPGVILFSAVGAGGVVVFILIMLKSRFYEIAIAIYGLILAGWITIQVYLIREVNYLQAIYIVAAAYFILLGVKLLMEKTLITDGPDQKMGRHNL